MTRNSKNLRPFSISEMPDSTKKEHEKLINDYVQAKTSEVGDPTSNILKSISQLFQAERQRQEDLYTPNPPNDVCNNAIIQGILIENARYKYRSINRQIYKSSTHYGGGYPLRTTHVFDFPFEKVFIWNPKKSQNESQLSETAKIF